VSETSLERELTLHNVRQQAAAMPHDVLVDQFVALLNCYLVQQTMLDTVLGQVQEAQRLLNQFGDIHGH
jgi:hypothetical protein